jgi:ABC-type bacteriocin/lantibiotic exporter with double-glycine peptidase domain
MLASFLTILLLYPLNIIASKYYSVFNTKLIKTKDERIKIMNEMLNGIKIIKYFAWEEKFLNMIKNLRDLEKKELQKIALLKAVPNSWTKFVLVCSMVSCISVYVLMDNVLDMPTAFTVISIYSLIEL